MWDGGTTYTHGKSQGFEEQWALLLSEKKLVVISPHFLYHRLEMLVEFKEFGLVFNHLDSLRLSSFDCLCH
jgi:hypothetical protein